jgi:hypothetical protein
MLYHLKRTSRRIYIIVHLLPIPHPQHPLLRPLKQPLLHQPLVRTHMVLAPHPVLFVQVCEVQTQGVCYFHFGFCYGFLGLVGIVGDLDVGLMGESGMGGVEVEAVVRHIV